MVHLRPEDFVDSDVSFGDKSVMTNIGEIKRRLNENPEDPDLPGKMTIINLIISVFINKNS